MTRRFVELVVRARRLVTQAPSVSDKHRVPRVTARRQVGEELTQFSFRLALVIDLAYVAVGAVGGAAVGRATRLDAAPATGGAAPACRADSTIRVVTLEGVVVDVTTPMAWRVGRTEPLPAPAPPLPA